LQVVNHLFQLLVGLVALRFRVLYVFPQSIELLGKWFLLRWTSVKYLVLELARA